MADEGAHKLVPDEVRCTRNDGRTWRCKRPCVPGKPLCELHYEKQLFASIKANKEKKRKRSRARTYIIPEVRVSTGREHLDRRKKRKHSWALHILDAYSGGGVSSSDDSPIRDPPEEDIMTSPPATSEEKEEEAEAAEEGEEEEEDEDEGEEELTRDLPHRFMSISPPLDSSKELTVNNDPSVKLGLLPPDHRLVNPNFRTKNVEPPPIASLKVVPYAANVRVEARNGAALTQRSKCHWCQRSSDVSLIECLTCKKTSFCSNCMEDRCIDSKEITRRCIICRKTCECSSCLPKRSKVASTKEGSKKQKTDSELRSLHYLITLVLPILEQINKDQRIELEKEAKLKGQILSEFVIEQVEIGSKIPISCNKCNFFILDMHRSCPSCSYKLCLSCCQESRSLIHMGTEHPSERNSVSDSNLDTDNIFCPSLELGGCGRRALDLRCVLPMNYTIDLEKSAKEILLKKESPQILDVSLHCSLSSATSQEDTNKNDLIRASKRKQTDDNLLYYPSIHDDRETLLRHFQKHWRNSHPVVVRDLLENTCSMTWDPVALFTNYVKTFISRSENDKEEIEDPNCRDWYKVEFNTQDSYYGSTVMTIHSGFETMRLEATLSSALFQKVFADQYAKIMEALPIQDYTNPCFGILNVAAMSAEESLVSEFSPHVYIACGSTVDIQRGKLFAPLRCSSFDLVNIVVHASNFPCSSDLIYKTKTLLTSRYAKDMINADERTSMDQSKNCPAGVMRASTPNASGSKTELDCSMTCSVTSEKPLVVPTETFTLKRHAGVQWDVFRREDVPKLLEYIQKNLDELSISNGSSQQAIDPLFNGTFFLDDAHKMRLKQKFKIQPWTFTQKVGEAVLVPVGCPYQTKNLKSCMSATMGFISPENVRESIKLIDKHRAISTMPKLEVLKMVINKVSEAIEELR